MCSAQGRFAWLLHQESGERNQEKVNTNDSWLTADSTSWLFQPVGPHLCRAESVASWAREFMPSLDALHLWDKCENTMPYQSAQITMVTPAQIRLLPSKLKLSFTAFFCLRLSRSCTGLLSPTPVLWRSRTKRLAALLCTSSPCRNHPTRVLNSSHTR